MTDGKQQTKRNKPAWSVSRFIYTGFGLGLAPKAPGTFGTMLGIPIYLLTSDLWWAYYMALTAAVFLLGWLVAGKAEKDLGRHDAPEVVIDEVAGYMLTMFLAPALPLSPLWGFVYFRIFDIWKPWPVRLADKRIPGALGVMLDDILAAIYAWLSIQVSYLVYSKFFGG